MSEHAEEKKRGAPAWFVSFGDMITLILTFFILLVTLGPKTDPGNAAKTIGSLEYELQSHGLPGLMSGDEKAAIFDRVRARFGLPPEDDPDRIEAGVDAANTELLRVQALERLKGTREVRLDGLLTFPTGSDQLSREQIKTLERRLAELTPSSGELLLIECRGDGLTDDLAELRLAHARAKAVAAYLLAEGAFPRSRLQVRIPADSPAGNRARAGRVDARLLIPLVPR